MVDFIRAISRDDDEATGRRAALRVWRLTHNQRGCNNGFLSTTRCRCDCPDHRCNEVEWPDDAAPNCEMCNDLRLIRLNVPPSDPRFGKAQPCPACHTPDEIIDLFVARNARALAGRERATLAGIRPPERQREMARWAETMEPPFLVLVGLAGTGKSYAAIAIARAAVARMTVEFGTATEFLDEMRATFQKGAEADMEDVSRRLRSAALLVIDEVAAGKESDWTAERIFSIIDHRYARSLPTIVTTNQMPDDITDSRLRSRLFGPSRARTFVFGGEDRRMV